MDKAVLLAVAASLCTATASVCQRAGARNTGPAAGFDARLIIRLARQPVWLLGIAAMIGGFVFQLTALRFGELALVQPILAAELLFVFGYLAVAGSRRPKLRDWLAAAAMSAGIGVFLRLAAPSGGRLHAPGSSWLLAGLVTVGVVLAALAVAFGLRGWPGASRSRRAAVLGSATGISWGFMAAVIKELARTSVTESAPSSPPGRCTCSWRRGRRPCCGLARAGGRAAGRLPARVHHRGPAGGQPARGVLFGEHIQTGPAALAGEALALSVIIVGATALSRSCLLQGEDPHPPDPAPTSAAHPRHRQRAAAGRP